MLHTEIWQQSTQFLIFAVVEDWSISATNLIGILSLFAGLLYFFQLALIKRSRDRSSILILFYFAILCFIIFFFEAYDNGFQHISIHLIPLLNFSVLTIGPTVYLYIQSLTSSHQPEPYFKHYIPAIVLGIVSATLQLISMAGYSNETLNNVYIFITVSNLTGIFIIQNVWYILKSLKSYNAHLQNIENIFSFEENVRLSWLRVLIFGYIAFFASMVLLSIVDNQASEVIFDLVMLFYIIYTGYHATKQSSIYPTDFNLTKEVNTPGVLEIANKEVNEKLNSLKNRLVELVESKKIYKNQNITIFELSEELNTNSKYLSQAINRLLNKSFIVFINEYRVEEAKSMLMDIQFNHLTIEAIGKEAGFKSKSAFNTAFKKQTGLTPSKFKAEH